MADLDYGELRVFPGNYDEYMTAATQARERLHSDNAKKKAQIADLQTFVSRFSANASKSRQATSRARQIEKIELDEVKPSSRDEPVHPLRAGQEAVSSRGERREAQQELRRDEGVSRRRSDIEVGERVGRDRPQRHRQDHAAALHRWASSTWTTAAIKWSENAEVGLHAAGSRRRIRRPGDRVRLDGARGKPRDDDQAIRATLGRLLFSRDEMAKTVDKLSGGERGRMLFGKIMLKRPNIMLMDEPTNHLDMESIESLNLALENYPGTLIFVSHDREFVSSLATRIIELTPQGMSISSAPTTTICAAAASPSTTGTPPASKRGLPWHRLLNRASVRHFSRRCDK